MNFHHWINLALYFSYKKLGNISFYAHNSHLLERKVNNQNLEKRELDSLGGLRKIHKGVEKFKVKFRKCDFNGALEGLNSLKVTRIGLSQVL